MTDEGDAGVAAVGTNVLEFHPADDDRVPEGREPALASSNWRSGRRYFVYVTTGSGLYRYDMNDIVEVVGLHDRTPLIRFIQKGKGVVSFTGEKLYEMQVIAAVDEALAAHRGRYHFIAAVAELVGRSTPRLVFLIEFDEDDRRHDGRHGGQAGRGALASQNSEYETKRKSLRYGPPVIRVVKLGEFDRYRRRMVESGQRADGQFKVLRLTSGRVVRRGVRNGAGARHDEDAVGRTGRVWLDLAPAHPARAEQTG